MQKYGHFFPPGIENLDQLMEHLQAQMQRMENMLESMSPQQRAQLESMMDQLMQDAGLRSEMQELAEHLGSLMPMPGQGRQYRFSGDPDESMTMSEAMQIIEQLDELEKLERELNAARRGDNVDDIDPNKVGDLLGPDAKQALDQLQELARQLEEAGYLEWKGGEMQLTPRATRKLGQKALQDIFAYLKRDAFGKHAISIRGRGGERTYDSKAYEFGDPFHMDMRATLGNALARGGVGTPVKLKPEDFEVFSTEFLTQSSTVLLIDMSRSMLLRGCFLAAKKVALALNHLIRSQFPKDDLYIVGFSGYARELKPEMLPQLDWSEYQYGTNLQHALMLSRQLLGTQEQPQQADHRDNRRRADRPPRRRRGLLQLPAHLPHHPGDHARGGALHPRPHRDQHLHAGAQLLHGRLRGADDQDQQRPRLLRHARSAGRVHPGGLRGEQEEAVEVREV